MNPIVELNHRRIVIELTPKVREILNHVMLREDGKRFYIETNGEVGFVNVEADLNDSDA